ncbi:MAG: hypothetical protein VX738_11640 [Planctomycetota bacterium]|nr:hypothetical protein [Planctomycetota bacterium]
MTNIYYIGDVKPFTYTDLIDTWFGPFLKDNSKEKQKKNKRFEGIVNWWIH